MRPVDFSCILRVSKSQMLENGTKDAAVDGVYRGVLDYLSSQSHKVCSFPISKNSICVQYGGTYVVESLCRSPTLS